LYDITFFVITFYVVFNIQQGYKILGTA